MPSCEMCGEPGDLKKTRVEDAMLELCEGCQEVGEVVNSPVADRVRKSRSPSPPLEEEPAEDLPSRVKEAREGKSMSVSDLAGEMKEKKSVVKRIETGKLVPDRKLAGKLERTLDIEVYESPSGSGSGVSESDSRRATIGDVAEIKED